MTQSQKITVVIPFFQREPGILARALRSVAEQSIGVERLDVVVVDDESPWSVKEEFEVHPPPPNLRVRIIRQTNGGPGAARNTGLAALEADSDFIAFLDSDDEWLPDHLVRAVQALSAGCNAYFANLYHPGEQVDEFGKSRRLNTEMHPQLGEDPSLRAFSGDLIHQIVTANVIYMTTLVIKASALGAVRFLEDYRRGGEDYLYWLALDAAGAKFAFSTFPGARRGSGVNLWDRNGWGTDGLAARILDEARYRRLALERFARLQTTRRTIRNQLTQLKRLAIRDAVHRLRRRKPVDWRTLGNIMRV